MLNPRQIDEHFNKNYKFVGNEQWALPKDIYKSSPWIVQSLQDMKIHLNTVKSQLNGFDLNKWSEHTRFREPSSFIISSLKTKGKIEVLTQAWCKFYECLNRFPIIPKRNFASLHLCEAPGGFISALNYYLCTHDKQIRWNWWATTLNPYYEGNPLSQMIVDDRLIKHTENRWNFGLDQTGDLTKYYNHEDLVQRYSKISLVTADGSVDCMHDPGEQESNVHYLHYCETMTALKVLDKNGSFVLKIFTMFEHFTICLLYLLNCCFREINICKPCASKSGNSEVYVICLGFKKIELPEMLMAPYRELIKTQNTAMFALSDINSDFLRQLEECAKFFMNLQCLKINDNVKHFVGEMYADCEDIDELKWNIAESYIKRYPVVVSLPKKRNLIKYYKRWRRTCSSKSSSEWEMLRITVPFPSDVNLCHIRIGKAIEVVATSQFCNGDISLSPHVLNFDFQKLDAILSSEFMLLQKSDFRPNLPQYIFQRDLFRELKGHLGICRNLVISGIPLLTKFLVGILYMLAIGFKSVLVFKKGVLVLCSVDKNKIGVVKDYFDTIDSFYCSLKENNFIPDISEVVPIEYLENGEFYDTICKYNDEFYINLSND